LAKFKGKDRAEVLRAMVNAYVQEHSERLQRDRKNSAP
jgi:hypothetical protein